MKKVQKFWYTDQSTEANASCAKTCTNHTNLQEFLENYENMYKRPNVIHKNLLQEGNHKKDVKNLNIIIKIKRKILTIRCWFGTAYILVFGK